MGKNGRVPLERALSKIGLTTRSQAREWVLSGRVKLQGQVEKNPLRPVVPETLIAGQRLEIVGLGHSLSPSSGVQKSTLRNSLVSPPIRLFCFHKPRGVVTTFKDERGRPTVLSLFEKAYQEFFLEPPVAGQFKPVGRLDQATSGLLLFTNSNRLSEWLCEPLNKISRRYIVEVRGEVQDSDRLQMVKGFEAKVDGKLTRFSAKTVELLKSSKKESRLEVELIEGKNREIRRIFKNFGHEVKRLIRVHFGPFELKELKMGQLSEVDLTSEEVRKALKGFF